MDLCCLCVGKFFSFDFSEKNIKWQKRFYEELLPFYCFCNGGGFINFFAIFSLLHRFFLPGTRMIHSDSLPTVTRQFFQIIKMFLNHTAFVMVECGGARESRLSWIGGIMKWNSESIFEIKILMIQKCSKSLFAILILQSSPFSNPFYTTSSLIECEFPRFYSNY